MRYAIVENGVVTNIAVAQEALEPNWFYSETAQIGDQHVQGGEFVTPVVMPTPEQFTAEVVAAVQSRLDDFAATRSYDGILSACTYATSQVPKFAAEGQYCVNARDQSWAKCYEIMADVQAGLRPMPRSVDEVMAELPALAWPVA